MSDFVMCRSLIEAAKGAEPDGGFVTDHLDAAEVWLDKIEETVKAQAAEIEKLREALHTPLAFIEALHENDPDDQIADNGMTVLVERLQERADEIPQEQADLENEARGHCGPYGTDTADDYLDDYDRLLMLEAKDRIEALSAQLHTVLDREAETHRRHDAKVEALSVENERLREVLRGVTPPPHFGESEQNKAWWAKARAALGETK